MGGMRCCLWWVVIGGIGCVKVGMRFWLLLSVCKVIVLIKLGGVFIFGSMWCRELRIDLF